MIFYSLTFALFFVALIMLTHLVKDWQKAAYCLFVSQYCFLRLLGCAFPTLVDSRYSDLLLWRESV